jgi:hypothetical protein
VGDYWTNAVRHPEDVGVGHIRRRVTFSQNNIATGVPVGALEKGAIPLRASVIINTAFNAATTNVFVVGDTTTDNSLVTSTNAAAGTVGGPKAGSGASLGTELAADTVFYAKFTQTGTAATAGDATVVIEFVNPRNWKDNAGAQ